MAKAIVHVHQQKIKKDEAAIIVRTWRGSKHYRELTINGPVKVIQSSEPDRCGARCWIECDSRDIEDVA